MPIATKQMGHDDTPSWVGISFRIKGVTDALFLEHWNLRNFNSEIKNKDGVDATGMHLLYPHVCLGRCNFTS